MKPDWPSAQHAIRDKFGEEYRITEDDLLTYTRLLVRHRKVRVGHMNCRMQGEVLHIDDFHLEPAAVHPPLFSLDLFFWWLAFPPLKRRTFNYQNRGLGTAMIRFLVDYARGKSAKRIEGEVKSYDFKNNPRLPDWYRRRGFNVVMNDGAGVGVAKISMEV